MVAPEPLAPVSIVRVKRAATGGAGGRLDDGRVIFVRHALPGELVRVEVTDLSRSFARGDAVDVLEASPERVTAPCVYARPGGWWLRPAARLRLRAARMEGGHRR